MEQHESKFWEEFNNKKEKYKVATDGTRVIYDDPYLMPHEFSIVERFNSFKWWKNEIIKNEGSIDNFTQGYKSFGFQRDVNGIHYKVWAPAARAVHVIGDFNNWNFTSHPCKRDGYGIWFITIPNREDGSQPIKHNSQVKLAITTPDNHVVTRIDPWTKYAVPPEHGLAYNGIYWDPPNPYHWRHASPPKRDRLRIYETHVGMSSSEEKVATYTHFRDNILPYVKETGYNCIQLMAIMEHTYYASFGYQITNFFAASSRYGTPDELKSLVDRAHELGITVLLDLVHSHASSNVDDGINMFDGSDSCFFHGGDKGTHKLWKTRLFNYNQWEVLRFLLSNLRWWIEEYHFDGFRFDGVTSMLLHLRADGDLPQDYNGYFGPMIDTDALRYLTLANDFLHEFFPNVITIAEDAMGYATLARPANEGGVGFDYRLSMGIPDKWKKLMLTRDEDWNMGSITYELSNRRWMEGTISYVECHDQAIVGDKTFAFWLMDKEMYTNMSNSSERTLIVDRGIALHKMMRLITCGLGGEGYLTFMGNEFGHPEWLDFPREGNWDSYKYCRRQWNLLKDNTLRYQYLYNFEKKMLNVEEEFGWLKKSQFVSVAHESDKVIVFERGELLFAFNFHPTNSYTDYRIPVEKSGGYRIVLNSDDEQFFGHNRIENNTTFPTNSESYGNRKNSILIYLPQRTALVFAPN